MAFHDVGCYDIDDIVLWDQLSGTNCSIVNSVKIMIIMIMECEVFRQKLCSVLLMMSDEVTVECRTIFTVQ